MGKKTHKTPSKSNSPSTIKGRLVEMIVASLHNSPNVQVEQNIRLPALRDPQREREIDVLLSSSVAGYPVRIAIECKNYKSIIDVPKIDAYIGKLQDIGIPTQHGVYVSVKGYTKGALTRSKEVGIKPLTLTGLTKDRLAEEFTEAIQSVIYLLPEITNLKITNNLQEVESSHSLWFLYDEKHEIRASLPDLFWKKWIECQLPTKIGKYHLDLDLPQGWQHLVNGKLEPILSVKIQFSVTALLISLSGKATQHALLDMLEEKVHKFKIDASFDTSQQTFPLILFRDENDLQKYLEQQSKRINLTLGRFMLPRVRFYPLYWPLSKRAIEKMTLLSRLCQEENRIATHEELLHIEGNDLNTIWEPIWSENPILRELK